MKKCLANIIGTQMEYFVIVPENELEGLEGTHISSYKLGSNASHAGCTWPLETHSRNANSLGMQNCLLPQHDESIQIVWRIDVVKYTEPARNEPKQSFGIKDQLQTELYNIFAEYVIFYDPVLSRIQDDSKLFHGFSHASWKRFVYR